MARPNRHSLATALLLAAALTIPTAAQVQQPRLLRQQIAAANFGADAPWFLDSIPFLEIITFTKPAGDRTFRLIEVKAFAP